MGIKYRVNKKYFNKWSKKMAYTLGYLFADGSVEYWKSFRAHYLKAISTDYELISQLRKELRAEHRIEIIPPESKKHKIKYRLRIGDKELYDSVKKLGIYPRKSLTMSFPKIEDQYLPDFVRGYFDGDGCVYIEKQKRLRIIFTCGSHKFLETLCLKLKNKLALKQTKIYNSRRSYQLSYSTNDALKIYKYMYPPRTRLYLTRKKGVFTKALKKCDNWKVKEQKLAT